LRLYGRGRTIRALGLVRSTPGEPGNSHLAPGRGEHFPSRPGVRDGNFPARPDLNFRGISALVCFDFFLVRFALHVHTSTHTHAHPLTPTYIYKHPHPARPTHTHPHPPTPTHTQRLIRALWSSAVGGSAGRSSAGTGGRQGLVLIDWTPADAGVQTISTKPWAHSWEFEGHVLRLIAAQGIYTKTTYLRLRVSRRLPSLWLSWCLGGTMASSLRRLGRQRRPRS